MIKKQFTLYFEFFGKKQKTTIKAYNKELAIEALREKINIHRVEDVNDLEYLQRIFKIK
jgi:hypothetical protein